MFLAVGMLLFGTSVNAQTYYKVTHGSGSSTYGGVSVGVSLTSGFNTSAYCTPDPTPYLKQWTITTTESATFTFATPVSSVKLPIQLGGGATNSVVSIDVNGSHYVLTSGNLNLGISSGCYGGPAVINGSGDLTEYTNGQLATIVIINGTINSVKVTYVPNSGSELFFGLSLAPSNISFTNGAAQNTKVCQNASATSINSLLAATSATGTTFTWTVVSGPSHGALGGFPATASVGTNVSPSGTTYTPTSGYSGPDSYTIQVSDGTNTTTTVVSVNVQAPPTSILGTFSTCGGTGATLTLSDAVTGGTWSTSNTAIATVGTSSGVVTGVTAGTAIITYSTGCGTDVTQTVTVSANPASISGTANACPGTTATLTDATAFGAWSSSTSTVATVGSSTGVVTGVISGTSTITYTLNTGCFTTQTFTVNTTPAAITGAGGLLCVGNTQTLSSATGGGAWSTSNGGVATVSSGTITGVSGGTATITYTSASGCITTQAVSVTALPTVSGGANVAICNGLNTTLTASGASTYTWSPATALTATTGTSVTANPASPVTYTVTGLAVSGCANTATVTVSVNPLPASISGANNVCATATTTLTDATGFGTWSSSTTAASVNVSTGVVTGVTAGTTTITYTLPTGCIATMAMTVNPLPVAVSGTGVVCVGLTATLSNGTTGGAWTSSNTSLATIVSGTGVMTGVAAGNPVITYTTASGCVATAIATVNPLPAAITGTTNVCVGLTTALTDATPSGTWSSSSTVATVVSGTGVVTGVAAGTATITYKLGTGCINTTLVTVNPNPTAIIGTTPVVCAGLTVTVSDATAGGTWSSSNIPVASIGTSSGIITGATAGTATITYSLATGCIATVTATVNTLPAAISGTTSVCEGLTTGLSDALTGGTWSSSNTNASVNSSTGLVTGNVAGTSTITYTLPTGCMITTVVTINPLPASITGTQVVCETATTTLADATSFGAWSASNTNTSVNSVSGVVTGLVAGTSTITYTLTTGCIKTAVVTVNPTPAAITGAQVVCIGLTTNLTDVTASGTWSSSNTVLATVNTSGVVTGVAAGYPAISYTLATGCYAAATVTVNPLPTAILGTMSACIGNSSTLSDATGTGTWSASNTNVSVNSSTGQVTGVAAGTSTITYKLSSTSCYITGVFTVNPFPSAISGVTNTCPGATTTLTDASAFGNWTSSASSVATIGSGNGIVSGVAAGTTTITYTLSTGCIITTPVTVNPLPNAITGTQTVCAGLTTALTDAGGGTWASSNLSAATVVSSTGVVTGVAAGTTTITYTLPTGCQATAPVTVNPLPAAITGTLNVCAGLTTALGNVTTPGTWSTSNTNASVNSSTGLVTGNVAGTSTITYTIGTGCIMTAVVTVNPLPAAITGVTNVCPGLTTTLSDATGTGTWSSSITSVATVNSGSGVVTGVLAGTTAITYTLATGCIMTTPVTVNPLPAAISGASAVCQGLTTTYTNTSGGGTWSTSNTFTSVNSSTGVVSGLVAGTSTVTYTLPTGCIMTQTITVNPLPLAINGASSVCIGLTTLMTDATSGGTWSSSDPTQAPIGATTGIVGGLSAGTPTITYILSTGCIATKNITVNPLPAAITGTTNVCAGLTTALSDATPSGTWSTSNTFTSVTSGGVVSGLVAGTSTITYTLPTGCIITTVVTVNPLPAAITGTPNTCPGATTALADATLFGSWTSSASSVATIGSGNGIVSGVAAGTTTITYTLSTGCIITTPVTVNPLPNAITGTQTVCAGLTTALTDAGGGTWASSNLSAATVAGTGVVSGLNAGTTTITYTLPTTCTAVATVTVNPLPAAINGPAAVCSGLTITMTDATLAGTWSVSNTNTSINSSTGLLTGLVAGPSTVTYTLPTGCIMTKTVTVNPLPGTITGTANVCVGLTTALSNSGGGTWSSSNLSIASVGTSNGIVSGFVAGTATIIYTLPTGCINTTVLTVNPLPSAITGTMQVCAGLTTALTDAGGGTWTSSNTFTSVVLGTGVVTGNVAGTSIITYTLPTGCITTTIVTVNPLPSAITGLNNVCFGLTTPLADPTPFGLWSSSNNSVATIGSGTGLVSGLLAGTTTITYQLATGCINTMLFTVNPLPTAILGNAAVCEGLSTTLSDAGGGTWISSNTTVATIGSTTGVMNGLLAGNTTITYTLPTGCIITRTATVNPLPAAITGATTHVCAGLSIPMGDGTPSGTWSISNTNASVNAVSGVVTGNVAGTATLTYTLPTSCIMTTVITVDPLPANITGTMSVCAGLTTTLSDATPSGTWSSSNTAIATVAANVVTGVLAGTATITYTLPTGCIKTAVVTVNPLPAAITGTTNVCMGLTTVLSDATIPGTWSSSNTVVASINSASGLVSGIVAGSATITYTITTGCIKTTPVTVNPLPAVITGIYNVCVGLTTTLSDATPSGTWSSSNTARATIGSSTGVVTGISAGTVTITYTLSTGCINILIFTVNPLPAAITGTTNVCAGLTTMLSDATPSGTWSSSDPFYASVNSSSGLVTGNVAGTVTITYTLPTGCIMTTSVLVNPLPLPIMGTLNVCEGLTTALSDVNPGGTWSNDLSPLVTPLTINTTTGLVTAIVAGTNIVTYTLPTGCIITAVVTVDPLPAAITGATTHVCEGLAITMSDATPLGTWSLSNTNASVNSSTGVVTGNTAGSAILTYMLPTGCIMTRAITVDPLPTAISGTLNVCAGLTTALGNGSAGGMWSIGSSTIATVNATSGVVTGVNAGTTMVTYTLPTGCIMTAVVTVDPLPAAITGTTQVCAGLTTALSNGTIGGTWTIGSSTIATVNPTTGVVTGILAGTTMVTYTLPTGCIMTTMVTVNPLPSAISGVKNVCVGNVTMLTDAGGGSWTSSDISIATVTAGAVTGVDAGTATITYTLPTGCITTSNVTVNPVPDVFAVTGGGTFCPSGLGVHVLLAGSQLNFTYQLYNGTTPVGGSPTIGTTLGLDFGPQTIPGLYTVVATDPITSCTSSMSATATVSLYPLPAALTVSGGGSYCAGDTGVHVGMTTTQSSVSYQLYQGSTAHGAAITGAGSSIDFGLVTVADIYTVKATSTFGCSATMPGMAVVSINALVTPSVSVAYTHFGDTICAGTPITFTASSLNGGLAPAYTWKVNGVAKGTTNTYAYSPANGDVVSATVKSNAVCPSPDTAIASVTMPITSIAHPSVVVSSDHGDTVCSGSPITYTATPKFGGSAQVMTWVLNGKAVDSGSKYTYIPKDGDIIYNTLFSNYRCRDTNRVFSNNIIMTVDSPIIPSVNITADPGVSIQSGTKVTFTTQVTDGGDAPLYQWFLNTKSVVGATSATFTKSDLNNKDSISVMVQRIDACGKATFNGVLIHVGGVSVLQATAANIDINVVPNPNKGEFTVKGTFGVSDDVAVSMELTNMLGQVVYKGNTIAKSGILDEHIRLNNTLANGMYLLSVRSEGASKVFHVVVEQ